MLENSKAIHEALVHSLVQHLVPRDTAAKVADWVKGKDFKVAGLDAMDTQIVTDLERAPRLELGEAIYDAYCQARGITRVSRPENLDSAIRTVAEKFHFASAAAMAEKSEILYEQVRQGLADRPWLGNFITCQNIEIEGRHGLKHFVNTWFKEWRENWGPRNRDFWEKCQTQQRKQLTRTYTNEELFEAIQEFLRAKPSQEYNYNQVADGLLIAKTPATGALAQRMAVKDALERLSSKSQSIYVDIMKYVTRPIRKGKKSATVYKWAPLRRKLDAQPRLRRAIIMLAILEYISENPDCTTRAIRESTRRSFGQIANPDVSSALAGLIEEGMVEISGMGPHRAFLHRAVVSHDQPKPIWDETTTNWD